MFVPDAALGALSAALIAGIIAIATLIVGKENKISEFKQSWIDFPRNDVADFIANVTIIDGPIGDQFEERSAAWQAMREPATAALQAAARIRMRLNEDDSNARYVLRSIKEISKIIDDVFKDPANYLKTSADNPVPRECFELVVITNKVFKED